MEINEYQQILLKCEYISSMCDSLLDQMQKQSLSKQFLKNKKFSDQIAKTKNSEQIQLQKQKDQLAKKQKQIDLNINQAHKKINYLKNEIQQLKIYKVPQNKYARQVSKFIREISQIQFQITQKKKLLNHEMQNLSCLQTSNIQLNQTLARCDKKESQMKRKMNKIKQFQKESIQLKKQQQRYQNLHNKRKQLSQYVEHIEKQMNLQLFNKIQAIAQSQHNLQEMQAYEKQLKCKLKEQQFIISEIQNRETQKAGPNQKNKQQIDDSKIFQDEVSNLRKTIANRKFKKKMYTQRKLNLLNENQTPKNKTKSKQKNGQSIFKISYEPFEKPNKFSSVNRFTTNIQNQYPFDTINSKSSPLTTFMNNSKHSQIIEASNNRSIKNNNQAQKISHINNDLMSQQNLSTLEVQTLQIILQKKLKQVNDELNKKRLERMTDDSFVKSQKKILTNNNQRLKTEVIASKIIHKLQKIQQNKRQKLYTQPILSQQKYKSYQKHDKNYIANSRFIDQIIQNNNQNINKLKNNVRIRTKQSQSQKFNAIQKSTVNKTPLKSKRNSSVVLDPIKNSSQKYKFSKSQQKYENYQQSFNKKRQVEDKVSKEQTKDQFQNQFEYISIQESSFKPVTLKYKQKVQTRSNFNKDKRQVIKKIEQIKNHSYQKNNKSQINQKQTNSNKISIFKLPSTRKSLNKQGILRKGSPEGVQVQESNSDMQLSKIQEEDQSIRKTKQSILVQ